MFENKSKNVFSDDKTSVKFTADIGNCGNHEVICTSQGCVINFGGFGNFNFQFEGSETYFADALAEIK